MKILPADGGKLFEVRVLIIENERGVEAESVNVRARHSVHAGILGRQAAAEKRGEKYDPDRHKVMSVRSLNGG